MATATVTMTVHTAQPSISSPLAAYKPSPLSSSSPRAPVKRGLSCNAVPSFPASRPLRPFPSIANTLRPSSNKPTSSLQKLALNVPSKKTKIIEPPKGFRGEFVLNLTQAELSRQD